MFYLNGLSWAHSQSDCKISQLNQLVLFGVVECDITSALAYASMPLSSKMNFNQHFNQVLGWNEYCKLAHEQAREAYLL